MYLLENIHFTRQKINSLYNLGIKYKWYGPEAPIMFRWIFYLLRLTPLGERMERLISEKMNQFRREFLNLQHNSLIPPAYWDTTILNRFEEYVLNNQAFTLEQCIGLYDSEEKRIINPESWEHFYLNRIKL